ncbi:TetR/AcrR family transcriptional regulator [Rhodobacter sp. CZR27]|uniref:TetR/AcrR family transcriptional regulator n=1 Tax=Rhodobacter sp. CZR27 TaxID=2033869 RepID=UPI000BBF1689|nr:TetR/AcrR family transcriptional regulator [Rhodobacter sp. CZR27]
MSGEDCKPKIGRPPVLSCEERTCQILRAAEAVFVQHGYSGATMDRIACAAGMSKRTLYQHFDDKLSVLAALLKAYNAGPLMESLNDPDPPGTPREILHRSITGIAHFVLGPEQTALTRLAVSEATATPEVARLFYQNAMGGPIAAFARRLGRMAERGQIRCDDPDRLGVHLIGATLNRQLFRLLTHPGAPPPSAEELESHVVAVLALVGPALGLAE